MYFRMWFHPPPHTIHLFFMRYFTFSHILTLVSHVFIFTCYFVYVILFYPPVIFLYNIWFFLFDIVYRIFLLSWFLCTINFIWHVIIVSLIHLYSHVIFPHDSFLFRSEFSQMIRFHMTHCFACDFPPLDSFIFTWFPPSRFIYFHIWFFRPWLIYINITFSNNFFQFLHESAPHMIHFHM